VDLDEGVIHSKESGYVYSIDVVKNSFLYFENRDIFEDLVQEDNAVKALKLAPFSTEVYPVLAKALPYPGSIVRFAEFDALVTPTSLHFLSKLGEPTEVRVFDRLYKSFDLRKGGDTHPSILLQFVENYMQTDVGAAEIVLSEFDISKATKLVDKDSSRSVAYDDGHYVVI
jgi:hypothetical protein